MGGTPLYLHQVLTHTDASDASNFFVQGRSRCNHDTFTISDGMVSILDSTASFVLLLIRALLFLHAAQFGVHTLRDPICLLS